MSNKLEFFAEIGIGSIVLGVFVGVSYCIYLIIEHYRTVKRLKEDLAELKGEFSGFKKSHQTLSYDVKELAGICARVMSAEKSITDIYHKFNMFKKEYSAVVTDVSKLGDTIKSVENFGKKKFEEFKSLIKKGGK